MILDSQMITKGVRLTRLPHRDL